MTKTKKESDNVEPTAVAGPCRSALTAAPNEPEATSSEHEPEPAAAPLALVGDSEFAILKSDPGAIQVLLDENMGAAGLNIGLLDRITMPAGGGTAWTVPTLEGDEHAESIEGVIIYKQDIRGYYNTPYTGGHEPPSCSSQDTRTGVGDPGGECGQCPYAEFGSSDNADGTQGKGQACSERIRMFILTANDRIPMMIVLPPTSLKAARRYFLRLTSKGDGMPYYGVVTRINLVEAQNAGGIKYSQAQLSIASMMAPEQIEAFRQLNSVFKPVLSTVPVGGSDFAESE